MKSKAKDGCWYWAGSINASGYGNMYVNGRTQLAHRVMYEIEYGESPDGFDVDHICDTRICINPEHLRLLTHAENVRKYYKPNHCNNGHELTPDNTYVMIPNKKTGTTSRQCKTCSNSTHKKRYKLNKITAQLKANNE